MILSTIARVFGIGCTAALFASAALAQTYPTKPIKILVGYSAGGGADTLARQYAAKLQDILNTPVIVENKPGAYELIAAQGLLAAPPDGYTLWLATTGSLVQGPSVRSMPYDPVKSFTYVGRIGEVEAVFAVKKGFPATSFSELITYAKANPGKVNYGSAGVGAPNHLLTEYISYLTGVNMTHIPFKSDADVAREIAGGTLDFAAAIPSMLVPFVNDGKMNAIAVTGSQRLKVLPNTPTFAEGSIPELKSLSVYAFYGVVGPAGMPPDVTKTLNEALNKVAKMPDIVQRFDALSVKLTTSTPTEFRQYVEKELNVWSEVAKKIKL